jgi:GxxExxY protein
MNQLAATDLETERFGKALLDSAFAVRTELGPGLLESVYESCLEIELKKRDIAYARQKFVPLEYRGEKLPSGLRLDFVVADRIVVELKAVEELAPVHTAQLMTYLKLCGMRLGFLVNFNAHHLRDGIKRIVL